MAAGSITGQDISAEARPDIQSLYAQSSQPGAYGALKSTGKGLQSASAAQSPVQSSPQAQQPGSEASQPDGRQLAQALKERDAGDQLAAALSAPASDLKSKPAEPAALLDVPPELQVPDGDEVLRTPYASVQQVEGSSQLIGRDVSTFHQRGGENTGGGARVPCDGLAGAEQLMSSYLEGQQAATCPSYMHRRVADNLAWAWAWTRL